MTPRDFVRWIHIVKPGKSCIYHVGNLQFDRQDTLNPEFRAIGRLADAVYSAHKNRLVEIKQRRVKSGVCEYIACRL
jgi:hypothetical protein